MKIDFKGSPEGTTHRDAGGNWLRLKNDRWDAWTTNAGGYWFCIGEHNIYRPLTEREPEPKTWTGEGMPPVGTVCIFDGGWSCEDDPFDKDLREGDKVTIIAHFKDGPCDLAAFTFNAHKRNPSRGEACVEQGGEGCFRPIRTPEQIAAEERNKAQNEIKEIILSNFKIDPITASGIAGVISDYGYRKDVKP